MTRRSSLHTLSAGAVAAVAQLAATSARAAEAAAEAAAGPRAKFRHSVCKSFAHFHTAGVPGRHEIDDSQELNYRGIARALADLGFEGFLAQEFVPAAADPLASLHQAVRICTV